MSRSVWIGCDFDHTLWDNHANDGKGAPMPGAADAIDEFHSRGWKVMVHSCNNPAFLRKMCDDHDLNIDAIWGEGGIDHGAKPVCAAYVDDRAIHFGGDWAQAVHDVLALVEHRPIKR